MQMNTKVAHRLDVTMILRDEKTEDEQSAPVVTTRVDDVASEAEEESHPPPYSPPNPAASPIPPPSRSPIDLPPTNFLTIFRPLAAIKGEYLLDINADPPPTNALARPDQSTNPDSGVGHKDNLRLESTHCSVEGLIWAAEPAQDGESAATPRHARIKLLSDQGAVSGTITGRTGRC
ncbi:hypothetical protein DENSPDRAFT_224231 [Dentipellis sp. KUC8613]|nr:hypothetical protein DENSPDRAFT_224231 [Dentipellis sp. KUC8613]